MPNLDAEVIIIGGGLIGNTLACLLGRQGVDCIVLEAGKGTDQKTSPAIDPRALAITWASKRILQSFDLWKHLAEDRVGTFRKMQVWDENGTGKIEFDCADLCQSTLGYIIEQSVLQNALEKVVHYLPSVTVFNSTSPQQLIWETDAIGVAIAGQKTLHTSLVVAADGVNSSTRVLAGIDYNIHDYKQTAVACVVQSALPHGQIARQRFLTDGPLAFLPMADAHHCAIVWSNTSEQALQLLNMDAGNFNLALQNAFDNTLGDVLESSARASFSLMRAQAKSYCRNRFVLVGDAAHCLHPLAGQGANLGLLDAASLAEIVLEARSRQRDIGSMRGLRRYERWRKGENRIMMMVMEGFKYLFENQTEPLPLLRNAGLNIVNSTTHLKHWIMSRAMGLKGDLPEIARAY